MGFNFTTEKLVHSAKVSTQSTSKLGSNIVQYERKGFAYERKCTKSSHVEEDAPVLTQITVPNPSTFL
jgi:hypothetical protein